VRIVTRERAFSCAKARRLLGYTPATPLREGIRRTVAYFDNLRADAPAGAADRKAR
jgi:nucleoside-diphosphate-sugar epimerase